MVYTQPRLRPVKWNAQYSLGFWDTNGSPNLGKQPDWVIAKKKNQKKKKPTKNKEKKREPNY